MARGNLVVVLYGVCGFEKLHNHGFGVMGGCSLIGDDDDDDDLVVILIFFDQRYYWKRVTFSLR
jgi:hypothetical protein